LPVNQPFLAGARWPLHDVRLSPFHPQRQRRQRFGTQIDRQYLHHYDREGNIEQHKSRKGNYLRCGMGKNVGQEFLHIVIYDPPFLDCSYNGRKVVIGQDDGCGFLGDIRPGDTHGYTDISGLQGRGVINPITGHGNDLTLFLESRGDTHLVLGRHARE